jgi:hypothetical protein
LFVEFISIRETVIRVGCAFAMHVDRKRHEDHTVAVSRLRARSALSSSSNYLRGTALSLSKYDSRAFFCFASLLSFSLLYMYASLSLSWSVGGVGG